MVLAKVRRVRESLVVTIPKEVAEVEGLKPGETVNIEVRKAKKSYFGTAPGISSFTQEEEMKAHN